MKVLTCEKCGANISGYEKFCNNCGNIVVVKEYKEMADLEDSDSILVRSIEDDHLEDKPSTTSKPKKEHLSIKIYLALLIPVIVLFVVLYATTREKDNMVGNSFHNVGLGGSIAQQGDWIYYSNERGIYKVRKQGGQPEKIVDGYYYSKLNVIGDYIYCNMGNGSIYKIGIEDKSSTCLYDIENPKLEDLTRESTYFININVATDKEIYFSVLTLEGGGIYRMDLEGGNIKKILDEYSPIVHVDKKYIYSISVVAESENNESKEFKINRLKRDGSDLEVIYEEKNGLTNVFMDNGYLYLLQDESKLYQYNFDNGEKKEVFHKESIVDLDVKDGWIYYSTMEEPQINKMKVGTNKVEKVTEDIAPYGFYLFDGYIAYPINDSRDLSIVKTNGKNNVTIKSSVY